MWSYIRKWCWTLRSPKFVSCLENTKKLHKLVLADRKLKLREISGELKISEGSVFTILHEHLSMRKFKVGAAFDHSRWKANNALAIQCFVCNCFNATKRSFSINMWQWIKHGSATSLWSHIHCQLSGQQLVKLVQSDQRRKNLQSGFWPPYFGMRKLFCSSITLRKEEPSIANIISHYWGVWRKKSPKIGHKWRRKKSSFTKIIHLLTSRSQRWQKYTNYTSNCDCSHPILQIWPPVATVCL